VLYHDIYGIVFGTIATMGRDGGIERIRCPHIACDNTAELALQEFGPLFGMNG
jgi:hypothetical protein